MTSMRSELGKIVLNNVFQSRKDLNEKVRETLEETTKSWGILCDRYEILRIEPPHEVKKSMQLQAEAERTRRKDIILSEAKKFSEINIAEGRKATEILKAEAHAQSVEIKARKEKEGLQLIAQNVIRGGQKGLRSLDYILKRRYYEEYGNILRRANVTVLPESDGSNGSSSDVLAAVALMMQQNGGVNTQSRHSEKKLPSRSSEKSLTSGFEQLGQPSGSTTSDGNSPTSSAASSNINWDAVTFFNNPSLDKRN